MNKAIFWRKNVIASNENDIKLFRMKYNLIKIDIVSLKPIFLINYVVKNQSCLWWVYYEIYFLIALYISKKKPMNFCNNSGKIL